MISLYVFILIFTAVFWLLFFFFDFGFCFYVNFVICCFVCLGEESPPRFDLFVVHLLKTFVFGSAFIFIIFGSLIIMIRLG